MPQPTICIFSIEEQVFNKAKLILVQYNQTGLFVLIL